MKSIKKTPIIFGILSLIALFAFAKQEKVLQIFRNGEIIQEYAIDDIDYIEVNDLIQVPTGVNASVSNDQITIKWNPVEDATYNIYRSADNQAFTLIASEIIETTYTDTNPLSGSNFYRVTAVVNGAESGYTQTDAVIFTESEMPSGIYLGIYGFSKGLQTYPIMHLSEDNISTYHSFVNGLSATESFTWLYYAVDKSINELQSAQLPNDLTEVSIVTFTDGLDIGSLDEKDKEEPGKYLTKAEYRDALHTRLTSETISDKSITAYTIGIIEGKDASLTTFRNNMNSLATSSENVFEVSDIENLNQIFQEVANSLSETKYVQNFVLSISGQSHNEKCRFTFDNVNSYSASKLYIEGTYNRQSKALTDIKYVGLTSTSGSVVNGMYNETVGKYDFTFEGLQALDGSLIPTDHVNHWFTDEGVWQDVDDEFFFAPDDATLQKIKRSAAIMLNLDCSKSMNGTKFAKLQEAANSFIQKLADNSIDPSEVSSVSLDKTSLSLQIGETTTLKATVLPSTAKLKTVTWSSSNSSVATVDGNGNITAVALGTAIITATTKDGGFTADCEVTVIPTPVPTNLQASNSDGIIELTWVGTAGATYTVYRSSDNVNYSVLAYNISTKYYKDKHPMQGTLYYKVKATVRKMDSNFSDFVSIKFVPTPQFLTNVVTGKKISMTWSNIDGATYNVYRSADQINFTLIASSLSANSYVDNNPLSKNNYYAIKAVVDGIESSLSPVVSVYFPYINGYKAVDLGLPSGIKWASLNVGAQSETDYGSFFAWGEISTKSSYTQTNSVTTNNTSIRFIGGDPRYDAATAKWGGTWRLPTLTEFEELINNCTWTWTTVNGKTGYSVKGPNGNTIFLPAAGNIVETTHQAANTGGYYWSCSYYNNIGAWRLNFNNTIVQVAENYKLAGISIRPVSE